MSQNQLSTERKTGLKLVTRSNLLWGGIVLLVIGLAILAYRGIYNRYWADDWCYNAHFKNLGFMRTMQGYYDILTYASNRFSLTLFSGIFYQAGIPGVMLLPLLVILLWVSGLYCLAGNIGRVLNHPLTRVERFFLAGLLVYATLFMAPNQFQVLYWRSGVLPYTFPLLSLTWLLVGITNHILISRRNVVIGLFAGLLAFIGVGFSEIGGTTIMGFLTILLILMVVFKNALPPSFSKAIFPLSVAIAAGFLSLLILAFSPSNELRRVYSYSDSTPIGEVPWVTFTLALQYIKSYFSGYYLPVAFLAVTGFFFSAGHEVSAPEHAGKTWKNRVASLALVGFSSFLACYAMLLPSAYIERAIPEEGRAMIIGCFILTSTTLLLSLMIGQWARPILLLKHQPPPRLIKVSSVILFLFLVLYTVRTYTYALNTIPFFEKRAEVWDERDLMIRQAVDQGLSSVEVREIDSYMGVLELHPQPNWVNNCAAEFYGIGEIRATLPWD